LRVAFAGTPEFALPALESLRTQHQIVGVLTQPDRPSGRGRKLAPSAVKRAALAAHLPLAQPETLRSETALEALAAWRPEVLVVVAYGLLLPPEVLMLPRFGCVNIHASLLPRWRGAAPIERAILAGDAETGVSIMRMDAGLDSGPLLLQRRIGIRGGHTGGTLRAELAGLGAAALLEALGGLEADTLLPVAQPQAGLTYAPKIQKAEARIDWSRGADEIERKVRAFNPSPIAETTLDGEQLRIFVAQSLPEGAEPSPTDANVPRNSTNSPDPGVIVEVRGESMVIRCGRGCLGVTQVQRPGRRPVSVRDYAHGVALVGRQLV
jgi:methionyl-tRNA formyltransferase